MHKNVVNLIAIENLLKKKTDNNNIPKIIAVSKTFPLLDIIPLIKYGHIDFGENKIQEAIEKWSPIKNEFPSVKIHMIGKLQTNKVKFLFPIFDYLHSLDNLKLANKIAEQEDKNGKKLKIFIQVNIGNENQKSGIDSDQTSSLVSYCKKLNLNVVGLMCIPPFNKDPVIFFKEISKMNKIHKFKELSMGMSSDYMTAIDFKATFLRIGSSIFGKRV